MPRIKNKIYRKSHVLNVRRMNVGNTINGNAVAESHPIQNNDEHPVLGSKYLSGNVDDVDEESKNEDPFRYQHDFFGNESGCYELSQETESESFILYGSSQDLAEQCESSLHDESFAFDDDQDLYESEDDDLSQETESESFILYGSSQDLAEQYESSLYDESFAFDDDQYIQFENISDLYESEDDDLDNESFFTYEQNPESTSYTIYGKRIVDLGHIFDDIKKINTHSSTCNFNDMRLAKEEVKHGLVSRYRFVCEKCSYIHVLETCVKCNDNFDLNYESVLGAMCIGIGFSQLEELTGIMGVPFLTSKSYEKIASKVVADVTSAAEDSMKLVAEEEKRIATEIGNVDENGTPKVKGIIDAAWSKRSYRTNYSALSGSAVIVGNQTQKVLWQGVANKHCTICKKIVAQNKKIYEHECNANYSGPSTGMEAKLILDGFRECEKKHTFRIHEVIGDGDASVIAELHKANIYQNPPMKIDKIECSNHLHRNARGSLRKLGEKGFLKKYLTTSKIEEIIKAVRCARKHWSAQDITFDEKVENLRQDIYNVPFHVFGDHKKCADYFCKKKNSGDPNIVEVMQANNSFNSIVDALARLRLNAKSILLNESSNVAEQFNSLIVKYTGGKRVNFSKKQSYSGRCKLAVLQHNTGRAYTTLCHYMKKTPNDIAAKIEYKRLIKTMWHKNKLRPYQQKQKSTGIDKNYGTSSCAKPDMDEQNFLSEREIFLEALKLNQNIRLDIQEKTKNQHASSDWKKYRGRMLTASNFGRVCCARSPESYTGIVNSILYTDISNLKQIAHGSFYEKNAIKKLEELEGITVEKCGLFIDENIAFLGATPDGLVGRDAIVEVKCPYSIYEKDIEDAILSGKLTLWSKERKSAKKGPDFVPKITGINRRHKWYFQVQGQLHITKRKLCYFAIWVGDNLPLRVEKIYRDDSFWDNKMKNQLNNFYYSALLPELVDSRMTRNMSLRKYDKVGNCIN